MAQTCVCPAPRREDDDDDDRKRKRPSSVIAKIKAYGRRMSQNSLDNLRKG